MENIELVRDRETELEFDINIQGTNKKEPMVRFVIEGKPINFSFPCNRGDKDDAWNVTVPSIPQLKNKAYPFRLEVIVDGYYFEPYRGTVDILAEPEVADNKVKQPEKPVVNAVKKSEEEKPKKKVTKEDLNIKEIINQIPDMIKASVKKDLEVPVEETVEETVEEIMEDNVISGEEIVEEDEPEEDIFGNMAAMWLNREDDEETVKDKKVKNTIDESSIPSMLRTSTKSLNKTKESELSEKDIKIRAILSSTKN